MKSNSKKAESLGAVCTRASLKNKKAGITLVSLVVTIIILLILAGISISLIAGGDGILGRASGALDANDQATATEKIEMKITYFNVTSYGENTRKANLQELAEGMFQDKEIEYVKIKGNKVASLDKIDVAGEKSIFVKLKEYPYEFEIGSDLQLASVDGVKMENSSDEISNLKAEMAQMKEKMENLETTVSLLESKNLGKTKLLKRDWAPSQTAILNANSWTTLETISLAGYGTGKAIISYSGSTANTASTKLQILITANNTDTVGQTSTSNVASQAGLKISTSGIIPYNENTNIELSAYSDVPVTPHYCYSILLIPDETK